MRYEQSANVVEVVVDGKNYTKVNYTKKEEIANCVTHGSAALIYAVCFGYLLSLCVDWRTYLTACVTCLSAMLVYTMSTIYHAVDDTRRKFYLRKADHSDIPFLVTGCSAAICLLLSANIYNYIALGLSVLLSVISMTLSIKSIEKFKVVTMTINFVIGIVMFIAFMINRDLILTSVKFIYLAGVILCVLGSILFAFKVRYMHAIFHMFVVCGTLCFYASAVILTINYTPF